jgi:thiaminase
MSASADLRARHAEALERFVGHPFFGRVEEGRLSAEARDRYFTAERHFVGAARAIFAHLLAKAPDLAAARHLVGILDGLVNAQEPLFDRIYAELGLADPPEPGPATAALAEGMTAIARDWPYAAGIAAMSVAEWSYAEVGRRGGWQGATDPTVRDWFRLHAEAPFLQGAQWLSDELDRVWTEAEADRIDAAFARAIALEIDFHAEPLQ